MRKNYVPTGLNLVNFIRNRWGFLTAIVIIGLAAAARLMIYGDLRLSIANNDTPGYITSSEVSLLSWEAFTGRRLFTTNLVYQLLQTEQPYQITVNGSGGTAKREFQPGFDNIVLVQAYLSVICWSGLALAFAGSIRNAWLKISSALLILFFAFVPQVADWDSLLTSESLTFSLFALQLSLLLALALRLSKTPLLDIRTGLLLGGWLIVVFFWTFLRDTNLYGLLIDIALILGLYVFPAYRRQIYPAALSIALAGMFILGWVSSGNSPRTLLAMGEVYYVVILPHPARVEFMQERGMPAPGSPGYDEWFKENSKRSYLEFLISHPGFTITLLIRDVLGAFPENMQPYFKAPDLPLRRALIPLGDALHPESSTPLFISMILLAGMWAVALKQKIGAGRPWLWLATWMFLFASMNISVVILGDAAGLTRHALLATSIYRLCMWIFPLILIDLLLSHEPDRADLRAASPEANAGTQARV